MVWEGGGGLEDDMVWFGSGGGGLEEDMVWFGSGGYIIWKRTRYGLGEEGVDWERRVWSGRGGYGLGEEGVDWERRGLIGRGGG